MDFKEKEFNNINYDDCITNITSSIEKYYHRFYNDINPSYKTNKIIDSYLDNKEYKNVIIFLFDAMGDSIIKKNLKEKSFLRMHQIGVSNSTYPPTTANCTTAFISGKNPCVTGWLGWSSYFKNLDIYVDNFPNLDTMTKVKFEGENIAFRELKYTSLGERIEQASKLDVVYHNVHCKLGNDGIPKMKNWINRIIEICNFPGRHYIYAYWNNPDSIMHDYGTNNIHSKHCINKINKTMKKFYKKVNNTFAIVSSDHGMVDVSAIKLFEYKDLVNMLKGPFTCDARTPFFFVKEEYMEEFPKLFNKYFDEYYYLKTKKEVLDNHIFGYGEENQRLYDLVGDYIGFAYSNKYFVQSINGHYFKGHHAGLLDDEMKIPIIILDK